jgi:hypothetical protein
MRRPLPVVFFQQGGQNRQAMPFEALESVRDGLAFPFSSK